MVDSKDFAGKQAIEATDFVAPNMDQGTASLDDHGAQTSKPGSLIVGQSGSPWWHSQFNLMLCVFALLGVAALLFVLLTPAPSTANLNTVVSTQEDTVVGQSVVSEGGGDTEQAPWDESRRKQARTDSQDILAELLAVKKELESQDVTQWGELTYESALGLAAEGDEFYKRKDFVNAVKTYQSALEKMQSLDALIPSVLDDLVKQGLLAVDDGKTELAREKFQQALRLDANHIPALRGIDRTDSLNQVLELLRAAALDEQDFDNTDDLEALNLAVKKYSQVLELDPRTEQATTAIGRVNKLIADKQYRAAMTQGFNALFANRYSAAKSGFSKAIKIKPDDATANAAYRQSLASDKRSSLSSLISTAKALEKSEEWATALSTYNAILQRDPNQVSAKLGKIRSQARKQLDQSIVSVLADPLALSRSTERAKAEAVLADARAIKAKGKLLNSQIAQLDSSLKQINSTIKVSFNSDQLTDVSLLKEGSKPIALGKFNTKKLALKPGRYVIRGTRLGFRDERKEIELRANGEDVQVFSISCTQAVAG